MNGRLASSFTADLEASWAELTPRFTVEYRFSPAAMVYATYSEGYKAGGFNSRGTIAENVGPFNPEYVDAYEIGAKTDLFDRMLRLNAAGFINKYRDLQGAVTKMGAVRAENITTNIAAAEIRGFEADATLRPSRNLSFNANIAYLHARYTDFCADVDGVFGSNAPQPRQCGPAVPIRINGVPNGTYMVPVDSTNLDLASAASDRVLVLGGGVAMIVVGERPRPMDVKIRAVPQSVGDCGEPCTGSSGEQRVMELSMGN